MTRGGPAVQQSESRVALLPRGVLSTGHAVAAVRPRCARRLGAQKGRTTSGAILIRVKLRLFWLGKGWRPRLRSLSSAHFRQAVGSCLFGTSRP